MHASILFTLFLALLLPYEGKGTTAIPTNKKGVRIDMENDQRICFDSLITDISCVRLEKKFVDQCIDMIPYKEYLYFMGETIAGKNVTIYTRSGKCIKEITFPDALMVNSMCIIPELAELWVVSRFKVINKFKLDGTPITRVSLPFPCANIIPTGGKEFLVYAGGACHERGSIEGHFMALTDFNSIHRLFLPMWGKREWPYTPYNLYTADADNKLFIFPTGIDTIYSYNPSEKELYPLYALDFHGHFLSLDSAPKDPEMHEIITKRTHVYGRYSFYQASGKLFFQLKGKREGLYFIHLNSHSLYTFDRLFDYFRSRFINPFIGSEKDKLYVLAEEKELVEHYQNIKCNYPAIQKLLPALSAEKDSWVLLTIAIKKEL